MSKRENEASKFRPSDRPLNEYEQEQKALRKNLALQLPFMRTSESMGNHDSKIVDAGSVD